MIKKTTYFCIFFFLTIFNSFGQTGPSAPGQDSLAVYVGSGQNQLLIPGPAYFLGDEVGVTAESSNSGLFEVLEVSHVAGQAFVTVLIEEQGNLGEALLTLTVHNGEANEQLVWNVHVVPYDNPGVIFEIHDIVFWQQAIPVQGVAVFDTLIQSSRGPYASLNWNNIPITVNLDCGSSPPCTGHDFFTAFYRGYLVPPVDGTYNFYMHSGDSHSLWLSGDEKFSGAQKIVARSSTHGNAGSEIGGGITQSAPVQLKGGKVYAFYATQWIIHTMTGGIMWDGPGISRDFIDGQYMMPLFDIVKPSTPANLSLGWVATESAFLSWDESTDNNAIAGYNMYVDGIRANEALIPGNSFLLTGLKEETTYHIVVTAVDKLGNESFVSNTQAVSTFAVDEIPPLPPLTLEVLHATGLALHLKWDGAVDHETEVVGYNVYINGELYNQDDHVYADNLIVRNLIPETEYSVQLESVDAGFNISAKSEVFVVSTIGFDPLGPGLGETRGRIVVSNRNVSYNHGFGLNGPYENGSMVNNQQIRNLVRDFGAGAIRWGAISANSKSFAGSVGTGRNNTYGRMMNFANELNAYFALTVGVQEGIDYITNPNTFLYLLEYLAGDASTTWGAVRAAEGFTEPLLQKGKGILLEFGNEVWGAAAHDAQIGSNYDNYAAWVREMSDVVRSSPYYDPEKIIMVYSGRYPHPNSSYGVNTRVLTGDTGHVECLGVSGYLGGNLNYDPEIPQGKSELDYYKNGIAMSRRNMEGFELTMKEMLNITKTLKTFYLYESNMTTSAYNGRFGQAITMTDYLASSMNYGSIVPTIFHLTGGEWRITRPAEDYRRLPLYEMGRFFNRFCKGHILETRFETNNVIKDANGSTVDWEPVGAYAYNRGEELAVLLINRDFENEYTVQLDVPGDLFTSSEATLYTLWHEDFSSIDTNIDSTEIVLTSGMLVNVPKHSMVVIATRGTDPGFDALPMGYFERKRPDSLSVYFGGSGLISTNRGVESVWAYAFPEDAFSRSVGFEIIENNTESVLTMQTNRVHVRGSAVCFDEGEVTIRAFAADNHDLADTLTVVVTNQGTNCPVSAGDISNPDSAVFYPNPARDVVTINRNIDERSLMELYDVSGQVIVRRYLYEGYEIPVGGFVPGIYLLRIIGPEGDIFSGKVQKY